MKRVIVIPAVLVFAFLPVFAIQAEKLSAPIPAPKVLASANSEFVLSVPKLRSTLVTLRYPEVSDKKFALQANCSSFSKPVWSSLSTSGIRTEIVPMSVSDDCADDSVRISVSESGAEIPGSGMSVPILKPESVFVELSDLADEPLFVYARDSAEASRTASEASKLSISASGATAKEKLAGLAQSYRSALLAYRSERAYGLVKARENMKYVIPVAGVSMPTEFPDIPGGGRPYRKDVTDGIHHGWDLMSPVGTPVRAVGDGVVVRVVSGFAWRDFDRITRAKVLNSDQEALNLDVYRGNQVWLKTADGNVTFYSHLSKFAPDVAEGKSVVAGEILGNIGITGVPDRNFDRPHLHFEIQVNPHDGSDSKEPLSVMRWKWLTQGMGRNAVDELSAKLFVK
ncbi:MAG: M23 family metallopeptidase [Patescibacteria group bacterium]